MTCIMNPESAVDIFLKILSSSTTALCRHRRMASAKMNVPLMNIYETKLNNPFKTYLKVRTKRSGGLQLLPAIKSKSIH